MLEQRVALYRCLAEDCVCGVYIGPESNPQFHVEEIAAGSQPAMEAAKRLMELNTQPA